PWIIENYDINGTGYGYCIYVGNTTDYFVVRNCSLHEASGFSNPPFWPDAGLTFYHVDNGDISNNIIRKNAMYGIYLYQSNDNIIIGNTVSSNFEEGMHMFYSDNNTLFNNTIKDMKGKEGQNGLPATGISLTGSFYNFIKDNILSNISGGDSSSWGNVGSGCGIELISSSENIILDNEISDVRGGEWFYFKDDMESGSDQWEHGSTIMLINGEQPLEYFYDTELDTDIISDWNNTVSVGLETTNATYHSFDTSFYMNETNNNKSAVTETFSLVNLEKANLSFWQKYNLTPDENGGFLQVGYKDPANGGVNDWDWKYITPAMYTGSLNASGQVNDSFGTPISECWNGVSDNGTFDWEYVGIDILDQVPIAYRSEVRIKFNFTNLGGAGTGGWFLDDVRFLVSRDENVTITGDDKDVWNLTNTMAHSGNYCWSNVDPATGYMKPGIDNYLTTKPIDLNFAMNVYLSAYMKFNINEDGGAPPDGFRIEVTNDGGASWAPITLGVRAGWGVSGTGLDIDDGAMDGKAYTGLPESGEGNYLEDDYWVNASSLSRVNVDLSSWSWNIIQIRFRVVNSNNVTYEHNNNHNQPDPGFGGFYVDNVEVHAECIITPPSQSRGLY
ncbi:MAG: right-handed parallel beta-helix repeat-containing protein, partial [Thermoplasmata archaeon]|nr:right-handed parallel beta-helix repeat-containing protein [Thermoplasmata archaeon]